MILRIQMSNNETNPTYEQMLASDAKWYKEFVNMKVTGKCNGRGCNNDAKHWFGNTASAYCDNSKCLDDLVADYKRYEEECAMRDDSEDY